MKATYLRNRDFKKIKRTSKEEKRELVHIDVGDSLQFHQLVENVILTFIDDHLRKL